MVEAGSQASPSPEEPSAANLNAATIPLTAYAPQDESAESDKAQQDDAAPEPPAKTLLPERLVTAPDDPGLDETPEPVAPEKPRKKGFFR